MKKKTEITMKTCYFYMQTNLCNEMLYSHWCQPTVEWSLETDADEGITFVM